MREKPARFDGEDEISLPLSRKRRVPVYGNSRAAAFDARCGSRGEPARLRRAGADSASVRVDGVRDATRRRIAERRRVPWSTRPWRRRSGPSRPPKSSARSSPTSTRRRRATRPRSGPSRRREKVRRGISDFDPTQRETNLNLTWSRRARARRLDAIDAGVHASAYPRRRRLRRHVRCIWEMKWNDDVSLGPPVR